MALLLLALVLHRVPTGPTGFDRSVVVALRTVWPEPGIFAIDVDGLAAPLPFTATVVVLVGVAAGFRRWRLAVVAALGPLCVVGVTTLLKPLVGRTIHGPNLAFPSGHTAAATAVGLVVALLLIDLGRMGPTLSAVVLVVLPVAAGITMATDQVDLDAHYPSDTVGGFLTAVAVVCAVALVVDAAGTATSGRRPAERSRARTAR